MNELISGMMLVMRERDLKMAAMFTDGSSEDDATIAVCVEALGSTDTLGSLALCDSGSGGSPGLLVGTIGAIAGDDDAGIVEVCDGAKNPGIRLRINREALDRSVLVTGHRRNWLDRSLR
jgi:hypothetical protein